MLRTSSLALQTSRKAASRRCFTMPNYTLHQAYTFKALWCKLTRNTQPAIALSFGISSTRTQGRKTLNGLEFCDHPSCAKYDNPITQVGPSSTNHLDHVTAPTRPIEPTLAPTRPSRPLPLFRLYNIIRGKTGYTHSLSQQASTNNTLNTQSRAQQTHSRSRSLRAHPHRADPPSVMPRAARLGCRSWVGRHR